MLPLPIQFLLLRGPGDARGESTRAAGSGSTSPRLGDLTLGRATSRRAHSARERKRADCQCQPGPRLQRNDARGKARTCDPRLRKIAKSPTKTRTYCPDAAGGGTGRHLRRRWMAKASLCVAKSRRYVGGAKSRTGASNRIEAPQLERIRKIHRRRLAALPQTRIPERILATFHGRIEVHPTRRGLAENQYWLLMIATALRSMKIPARGVHEVRPGHGGPEMGISLEEWSRDLDGLFGDPRDLWGPPCAASEPKSESQRLRRAIRVVN